MVCCQTGNLFGHFCQRTAFEWVTKLKPGRGFLVLTNSPLEAEGSNPRSTIPSITTPKLPTPRGSVVLNLLVSFYTGSSTCGLEQEKVVFLSQPEQELRTASYLSSYFLSQHCNWIGPDGGRVVRRVFQAVYIWTRLQGYSHNSDGGYINTL